jgi:hypothetical protein
MVQGNIEIIIESLNPIRLLRNYMRRVQETYTDYGVSRMIQDASIYNSQIENTADTATKPQRYEHRTKRHYSKQPKSF